jgi:hypothetical protein
MPLPFFKKDRKVGLIVENRQPDGSAMEKEPEGDDSALESCAEDLLRALNMKDIQAIASALRSAFLVLESEPHEEAGEPAEGEAPEEIQ